MTEEEWVRATESQLRQEMWALDPRRQRLLAVAVCRAMGRCVNYPAAHDALNAVEHFADTGKSKAALRRARQSVQAFRGTVSREPNAAEIHLALFTIQIAASENAVFGTLEQACQALVLAEGLSVEGVRRQLFPAYSDVTGGEVRSPAFVADWSTTTVVQLARGMYESRNFSAMPILADALQEAGCDSEDVLNHCRDEKQVHVRGCWVVDLVLGKT